MPLSFCLTSSSEVRTHAIFCQVFQFSEFHLTNDDIEKNVAELFLGCDFQCLLRGNPHKFLWLLIYPFLGTIISRNGLRTKSRSSKIVC